ncbi:MAG: DotI/IcmL/TraM family protein [Gammaproteobacteria bacterium]|nr:DotI/IcmL/TraM family protein [Gammaproteobacteria bacterium]
MLDQNQQNQQNQLELSNFENIYDTIVKRNQFYQTNLRFLLVIYIISILSVLFLMIAAYRIASTEKTNWYIPTNLDGTIIKHEDLTAPISDNFELKDDYIINWVQNNIQIVYDFDFMGQAVSYRNMIGLFTPEGFTAYANALESQAQIFKTIQAKRLVVQAYGCGNDTVEIVSQGVQPVQGYSVYTWRLSMPIVARIVSPKKETSVMRADLTIELQRVPKLIAKNGLAIYGFIIHNQKEYVSDTIDPKILCQALVKT